MIAPFVDLADWRKRALAHAREMLAKAGPECAIRSADDAEALADGYLTGLGAKVREEVAARRAKGARP